MANTFKTYETSCGRFVVLKNNVQFSPYFPDEAQAAMFLYQIKYNRGCDMVAVIMADTSWKQAHGTTATLPVFGSVVQLVSNRINCNTAEPQSRHVAELVSCNLPRFTPKVY